VAASVRRREAVGRSGRETVAREGKRSNSMADGQLLNFGGCDVSCEPVTACVLRRGKSEGRACVISGTATGRYFPVKKM
jgi:hypothetical protein